VLHVFEIPQGDQSLLLQTEPEERAFEIRRVVCVFSGRPAVCQLRPPWFVRQRLAEGLAAAALPSELVGAVGRQSVEPGAEGQFVAAETVELFNCLEEHLSGQVLGRLT
jgi:hypothetical protein